MLFEQIKQIIDEHFIYEGELTPDTRVVEDLGADSFDIPVLINALEDHLQISISTDEIVDLKTVGDLLDIIRQKI